MRKLLIVVVLAIASIVVLLVENHWFDSKPVEPEIIGTGYIHQSNGVYRVVIGETTYQVGEVIAQSGSCVVIAPADGTLVTAVKFGNNKMMGKDVKFMAGEWNEQQIEEAFACNYVIWVLYLDAFVFVLLILYVSAKCEEKYCRRKVVQA